MTNTLRVGQTIYWDDDPGKTRIIRRFCKVCFGSRAVMYSGLVSPQGVIHHTSGYADVTVCGKDCTGSEWWHRS